MGADPGNTPPHPERAHLRVAVDVFVRVVGTDRDYAFRTRDLSMGGLFLYTRVGYLYPFCVGGEVAIELHDADQTITLTGEVIRVVTPGSHEAQRYPAGFAVRLRPLGDVGEALRALILRHAGTAE